MIHTQNEKTVVMQVPNTVSAATQAVSSDALDTIGWHSAKINIFGSKISASNLSNAFTEIFLQHATAATGTFSTFTNAAVNATTNTTAAASEFTVASQAATTLAFNVELNLNGILGTKGLQRFIRVSYKMPAGNLTNAVVATLYRGDESPSSDAEAGAWTRVKV